MADTHHEVPWRGTAIEGSAPEQLAVTSWLQGGPAPTSDGGADGDGGSVLELGCGDGANLLPMAWYRPGWRFVGVDADGSSLASAREGTRRLGVRNLELIHSDLRRVALGDQRFDV